ncbi:MAG: ABC transporter ATP-binding protein [Gammaproteobacteria bacterium]|nr:ABC transporter ATP-binding protein [Gammaproteobacteria bacterium]
MSAVLEVRDLVKTYGDFTAVNGISFAIEEGRCFGLLGPNGAGKTTTIEMMEGIKRPTTGQVLYRGEPLGKRFSNEAGIQFQSTALQDFLTVRDTLRFFSELYPNPVPIPDLLVACSLEDVIERDTRRLSGGQRQRLLLAIALVNDPEVIFLDEPTTGLDPQARRNFWELINGIKARGKTIVLTTHYMEEAERLCDELVIVDQGRLIAQGTPDQLLADYFGDLVFRLPADALPGAVDSLPYPTQLDQDRVEIFVEDASVAMDVLRREGVNLERLQIRERTLEDLFLQLTGHSLRN